MCDYSIAVSCLCVALLRYGLRIFIKLKSSLFFMVQFRREWSIETFNMEQSFLPLWASQFTRLLGPLSFKTCDCFRKGVASESAVGILLFFTGEYWRGKERLDVTVFPAINAVQIFDVNLHCAEWVIVRKVMDCLLGLLLCPLFKAWEPWSLTQAIGETGTCLLTTEAGLLLTK